MRPCPRNLTVSAIVAPPIAHLGNMRETVKQTLWQRLAPARSAQAGLSVLLFFACGAPGSPPAGKSAATETSPSLPATAQRDQATPTTPLFEERARSSGLDFVHFNGMSGQLRLAEITCAGGGYLDFDGDGDLDLYLLQGAMLGPGETVADALDPPHHPLPLTDRLFRNELIGSQAQPEPAAGTLAAETLRFTDITEHIGLATTGYGCSLATGDFDGDGKIDLYIANLGANQLLRNLGDGTFEEVTERAGAGDDHCTVSATFFDFDLDGDLDLFIANNVDLLVAEPPPCFSLTGAPDYCGPGAFAFQGDRLLRNRGDGTFEEVTEQAGMAVAPLPSLGVVAADFNADGWPDLYVANDGQPNRLWINRGDGTFEDRALLAGSAVNAHGESEASMGVDVGDFDRDGDADLFLAHLVKETNTLYRNDNGQFGDYTLAARLGPASLPFTSFGAGWLDFDNDGWLDLMVVNGAVTHIAEQVRQGDPFPLHQTNQLFHNLGRTEPPGAAVRFADVTAHAGPAFTLSEVSRALALGDVDNDGDLDALVVNNRGPARLLINRVGQDANWIGLRLVEGEPGSDSLGARATLIDGGSEVAWGWVHTDGSFNAARDPRLLFGLGTEAPADASPVIEAVHIAWPDGSREQWRNLPTGRYTTLRKGTGQPLQP